MIQRTAEEQAQTLVWHRRRRQRVTPRTLLRESDELMFWLEECAVKKVRMVPGWLVPRLTRLVAQADSGLLQELARERRPLAVTEILYRAQESLMRQALRWREPARVIPLFKQP